MWHFDNGKGNEMDTHRPQGRPMHEIRAIVAAENERFDAIGSLWHELTDAQQEELVATAQAMHERNDS